MSAPVIGVNHAVLWVTDPTAAAAFYVEALGLEIGFRVPGAVFLRSPLSDNDHDLALMQAGAPPAPGPRPVGLYHLAWEVPTLADLAAARRRLVRLGALVGESDHGVSKSLYARDPDTNEFEVMWQVPLGLATHDTPVTAPLDLDAEIARFGADTPTRTLALLEARHHAGSVPSTDEETP